MRLHRRQFLCVAGGTVAGLSGSPVARALDYPTHPVIIVVPFAPGGSADIVARLLAQVLEQRLGKSFVVENRPGAGTIIAAGAVAKAEPDGYQLLMAPSSTMAVNVTLYKKLPYDPTVDFIPSLRESAGGYTVAVRRRQECRRARTTPGMAPRPRRRSSGPRRSPRVDRPAHRRESA